MKSLNVSPIGYVENNISDRSDMIPLGVESKIIINESYIDALDSIGENSHIIVLSFLDKANRSVLKVKPKKCGFIASIEKGVFATRSPDRPNPIAVSVCKLLKVEGNTLSADRLDVVNQTPVIDIKPYSPGMDAIYNVDTPTFKLKFTNFSEEKLYEYFKNGLKNYCFKIDASLETGINALIQISKALGDVPDRSIIDYIETDFTGSALDCLYLYSKFTPGERRIIIFDKQTINTYVLLYLINKRILLIQTEKLENGKDCEVDWLN